MVDQGRYSSAIGRLLGADFLGHPSDPADVLSAGVGDVRRASRDPELRSILLNPEPKIARSRLTWRPPRSAYQSTCGASFPVKCRGVSCEHGSMNFLNEGVA